MSLELKSIYELRGIAQAVGVKVDWSWNRQKLVDKIEEKTKPPPKPRPQISDSPQKGNGTQEEIVKALSGFREMVITFPTADTWQLNYGKKQDSGSVSVPIRTIINCAKVMYD